MGRVRSQAIGDGADTENNYAAGGPTLVGCSSPNYWQVTLNFSDDCACMPGLKIVVPPVVGG